MALFSERYGYTKPSDIVIREKITLDIQNAICSCYDRLQSTFHNFGCGYNAYLDLEEYLWIYFLNKRKGNFQDGRRYNVVATAYIEDTSNEWNKKLDLIEDTIKHLYSKGESRYSMVANDFRIRLNGHFSG